MNRALAAVASAALIAACAGSMQTPESVLEDQLRDFHGHLRWGRFDEAAAYVAPDARGEFLGSYQELGDDYEITEYELRGVTLDPREDTADVTVWIQWFRLPSTRVEEVTYDEHWAYDRTQRVWLMTERTARE